MKTKNTFTQKETELHAMMWEAEEIVQELLEATRNKEGFYDTLHPLRSTVGALASRIDDMLTRMQYSN